MIGTDNTTHVALSPSGSHRWMHCPGSVEAEAPYPDESSPYAAEGTAAHALAEMAFTAHRPAASYIGEEIDGIPVTEEMAEHTQVYVDTLHTLADGAEIVRIERKLFLPPAVRPPGPMGGTCDAWFWYPAVGRLVVADLKFGKGVVVEAKDNPQLRYYALLAYYDLVSERPAWANAVKEIEVMIVQPRAFHPEGPIRSDAFDLATLRRFGRELLSSARRAMEPQAGRSAGDWCRFCKAKPGCATFRDKALDAAQVTFGDVTADAPLPLVPVQDLTPDNLGRILRAADVLEAWISSVRSRAMRTLEDGGTVPGFALKAKRANRQWANEHEVAKWVRTAKLKKAEAYTAPELKTPAQLEKVAKAHGLTLPEELTVRVSSGYTLTTDDDPKAVTLGSGLAALDEAAPTTPNAETHAP